MCLGEFIKTSSTRMAPVESEATSSTGCGELCENTVCGATDSAALCAVITVG